MPDPFAQPQKLIDRAKRAVGTLEEITTAFFHLDNFELGIETNTQTGWKSKKLRLIAPIPDAIEEITTNALLNAKRSFDQMLFAATTLLGRPRAKGNYPWADNPTALHWRMVNKKTGEETIPNVFWDLIRSQEPYPAGNGYEGGNTYILAMARLVNDTHTIGIQIGGNVSSYRRPTTTSTGPGTVLYPLDVRWDSSRNEIELERFNTPNPPESADKHHLGLHIGFNELAGPELHTCSVTHAILDFANHAQFCLDGFKRRVAELGF